MKTIFTTTLFLITTCILLAQNAGIKGHLTDHSGQPIIGANAYIKSLEKGSQSDGNGNFSIHNLHKGTYVLNISFLGYKTQEIEVVLEENEIKDFGTIILYEGNELLQEVVVSGERENKFSRKRTAYVAKLPLRDLENTQVYTTVTSELLKSQMVTNIDDALNNATGVNKLWEATGRSGDGTGYYSIRGFSAQPAFVDGVPGFTFSALDPSYIERIEVLKGPSATLFGSTVTSLGGLINVVTKKPYEGFGGSIAYTGGSFGTHRISADVNTPLAKKNGPYLRINASYLTQNSFQDAGFRKTFFVAPSLTYRVNNRLNLTAGVEFSKTRQTNPAMLFVRRGYPMPTNNIDDFGIDRNKSFTDDDIYLESPTINTRFVGDYKLSDQWTSQTILSSSYTQSKGYYQYMIEGAAIQFLNPNPQTPAEVAQNQFIQDFLKDDVLTRVIDKRDSDARNFNFQQNFIGDFKIGDVRNRMVFGLDYVNVRSTNNNKAIHPLTGLPIVYGFFKPDGTPVDDLFFTPNVVETEYPINQSILDPIFDQITPNDIETQSQTMAAYVSDVVNFSPKVSAMLGLRLDYFDQEGDTKVKEDDYTKTTFSPKFGVVYQPIVNKVSLFTNYQTGYLNVDPVVSTINNQVVVQTFDPQKANQFEAGTKTNLMDGKLNLGVSYYNIKVNDRNSLDPTNPFAQIVLDEITSQGLEFEANVNPISGLNIRGSFAYNDSKITKTSSAGLRDTRPEEAGPKVLYNLWGDYKFGENSKLKNFGIGAGFNGASEYFTMNNRISGQFKLPSYLILNATVYYETEKIRVAVKANNISDVEYYKGWSTVNPQAPRAFLASLMYKF